MDKQSLHSLTMEEALLTYAGIIGRVEGTNLYWPTVAELGRLDRFFLLTHLLHRKDMIHPFLYERCREVEANTDGHLDLWARGHYKSTIITFGGIIQEVIIDPESTICILSYNNAIATDFLVQIKREMETNSDLQNAYPDIFHTDPKKDAQLWSAEKGIIVKRKTNPREPTIIANGLVDGQPVSRHFSLRVYDDIITRESVTTPGMIAKVTEAWELSLSLMDMQKKNRQWYAGTRYNANDTYQDILDREYLIPRIHPATDNGRFDGDPVFLSVEAWEDMKKGSSEYVIACQQLLNPLAGKQQEFDQDWMRTYEVRPRNLNVYIMCDPASSKKGHNCNTAMAVIGIDAQYNKYFLDGYLHKMDLNDRWKNLRNLRNKWVNSPGIQTVNVGYEKYGMQSDIEHFETMMRFEGCNFHIEPVSWTRDGTTAKDDRIRRLIPDHKNWRFFYPEQSKSTGRMRMAPSHQVAKSIKRVDEENNVYNVVDKFYNLEYKNFPHSSHKDMLDAMSRIYDMEITPPMEYNTEYLIPHDFMDISPSTYEGIPTEPEVV